MFLEKFRSVSVVSRLRVGRPKNQGSMISRDIVNSRHHRLWGPLSLLSNGYRGSFAEDKLSRGVKLTTHVQAASKFLHTSSWLSA
jgi:hypothetical protein